MCSLIKVTIIGQLIVTDYEIPPQNTVTSVILTTLGLCRTRQLIEGQYFTTDCFRKKVPMLLKSVDAAAERKTQGNVPWWERVRYLKYHELCIPLTTCIDYYTVNLVDFLSFMLEGQSEGKNNIEGQVSANDEWAAKSPIHLNLL